MRLLDDWRWTGRAAVLLVALAPCLACLVVAAVVLLPVLLVFARTAAS